MIQMFSYLDLETCSSCNRRCPTCLRNSHPDRGSVASWFKKSYLPLTVIRKALRECKDIGYTGQVVLSHYNEPLQDERLPEIAKMVHRYGFYCFLNTNGDYLNPELASQLDGHLDKIIVSLYQKEPVKSKRAAWIPTLFKHTEVHVIVQSEHMTTHFSPRPDLEKLIQKNIEESCSEPRLHCIINHRRQFLLCCDDLIGNFNLGTFPETSIQDYWFGKAHTEIYENLSNPGGRKQYSYCSICPR